MRKFILTSIVVSVAAVNAQSQMTVSVTGVPGSGTTTWAFGGSATDTISTNDSLNAYSITNSPNHVDPNVNLYAHATSGMTGEIGTLANLGSAQDHPVVSGDLTVTGTVTGDHAVDGIFLDSTRDGFNDDDFAWLATGSFLDATKFEEGDDIDDFVEDYTFSGSGEFNIDITTFGVGDDAILNSGDQFTVSSTSDPVRLTMTFTAVPEPGEYAILVGILALGFGVYRKRLARSAQA